MFAHAVNLHGVAGHGPRTFAAPATSRGFFRGGWSVRPPLVEWLAYKREPPNRDYWNGVNGSGVVKVIKDHLK